ncbi:Y_Y_Y domain-containing protein [Ekhidna lutea]|uniref:Y_Y_Y domain-containing protein n=1 Tax=Ekhidna lutea TaxID=447679 RepID=A0A239HZM3_EKHLU|nr:triple tyrosine motif-containing protein [Ekhidna lutea]SNS86183.1 Y_Y_Y domain-containing protein [Ekhidna lutea]
MRHLLLVVFCLSLSQIYAQKGDFLLTHHFPRHSNIDNSNFEITNDNYGRLCIANRSGVLKYDGEAWDFYQTPSAALSLTVDSTDVVYVGCIGTIGMIDFHERRIGYKPILPADSLDDLFLETHYFKGRVYFMGSKNLVIYDIASERASIHKGEFLNIYELDAEMFVNTADGETFVIHDSLTSISPLQTISYSSKRKGNPDLAVGFDNELYEYQNFEFSSLPQNKHIKELGFEIKEIQWVNDSLFVCSTFENGLLIFNKNDEEYLVVTDYQSGLPDNEVYTIHTDNSDGIWVATQFGITHIAPLFPAHSYSHFQGLNGNLTSVSNYDDDLWVTTSLGLFYFDRDTIFENKVYYEVQRKNQRTSSRTSQASSQKQESDDEKPLLKRLFGKKKLASGNDDQKQKKGLFGSIANIFDNDSNVEKVKGKLDKNAKYVRKVRQIPVDVNYTFKQVNGANGKFLSVLPYKDKLLGVSTSGIYEVTKKGAEIIIPESIRWFMVNSKDQLVISTSNLQLKVYKLNGDVWIEQISQSMDDIIVSMREGDDGKVWMAGSSAIYKTSTTDSTFTIEEELPLNNIFLDEVNILNKNDTLYFINSQGYYYYDSDANQVVENTKLEDQIGPAVHHLYDPVERGVWVFNGKVWHHLKEDGSIEKLEYLGLFPDLRAISIDQGTDKLWLITQNNELLKYDPTKQGGLETFNFFLKKVSNEKGEIDQSKKFTLAYDENFLSIELSKPDFLGLLNPEFQYKLEGLHEDWSEWTRSKSIDFSFLPEGSYNLRVRSRDAFGRVEEGEVLSFTVKPPYWQTPWFYAIQIIFFGGLVFFSTRLNQDSSKNRLLRGGLTLLTLVLIIEFLQSAIGSLFSFKSTPVVDFLLDASIAFMIFPLERLLRELMTKGKVKMKIKKKDISLIRKDSPTK